MTKWHKEQIFTTIDRFANLGNHYDILPEKPTDDDVGKIQVFGTELADRIVGLLNKDDEDAELTAPSKELQLDYHRL